MDRPVDASHGLEQAPRISRHRHCRETQVQIVPTRPSRKTSLFTRPCFRRRRWTSLVSTAAGIYIALLLATPASVAQEAASIGGATPTAEFNTAPAAVSSYGAADATTVAPPAGEPPAHLMEPNILTGSVLAGSSAAPSPNSTSDAAVSVLGSANAVNQPLYLSSGEQGPAPMAAVVATTAAGRTPGTFEVSTSGAATYQIPLWTPPGIGDVHLNLAIAYNSRAGNGPMGQGWSLSGLSAISRCNKTWAQDGAPAPVANLPTDRYCLDGQQLKLVSGSAGSQDAVYATETESFSRIVVNAVSIGGPASFTVTTKNGLVYEYGTTADSRIYIGQTGAIRTWALARIRDRATDSDGNSISIGYSSDAQNGTLRVSEINYPYTTTGQGPFYRVSFVYSPRPATDPLVGYLVGYRVQEVNQLDTITITDLVTGTITKSYNLVYAQGTASGRLTLKNVQECSSSTCLAPTVVDYQQGAKSWEASTAATTVNASYKAATVPVDINGDGMTDLVYPVGLGNSVMEWRGAFAQYTG